MELRAQVGENLVWYAELHHVAHENVGHRLRLCICYGVCLRVLGEVVDDDEEMRIVERCFGQRPGDVHGEQLVRFVRDDRDELSDLFWPHFDFLTRVASLDEIGDVLADEWSVSSLCELVQGLFEAEVTAVDSAVCLFDHVVE